MKITYPSTGVTAPFPSTARKPSVTPCFQPVRRRVLPAPAVPWHPARPTAAAGRMPGPGTGWKPDATHWQDASVTSNSRRAPSLLSLAEWLRNTKTRLLAVAISLAAFTPVFGQTPPGITTQPADQVVDIGFPATFTVTATGTAPLTYQWRFNDADLAGRTGTNLVLSNIQPANLGSYTVVVTNASGPPSPAGPLCYPCPLFIASTG